MVTCISCQGEAAVESILLLARDAMQLALLQSIVSARIFAGPEEAQACSEKLALRRAPL